MFGWRVCRTTCAKEPGSFYTHRPLQSLTHFILQFGGSNRFDNQKSPATGLHWVAPTRGNQIRRVMINMYIYVDICIYIYMFFHLHQNDNLYFKLFPSRVQLREDDQTTLERSMGLPRGR